MGVMAVNLLSLIQLSQNQKCGVLSLLRSVRLVGIITATLLLTGYLALAGVLPAADDELYYWCWSRSLQWSYYDNPGMSAYLIRLATTLFGHSITAIRLPACLTAVVTFAVIAWLSRPRTLLPAILLTPAFTFGAILVTPDTPLLLFWSLYLAWLVIVHERLTPSSPEASTSIPVGLWLLGGLLLGGGLLGKYTMGLAGPAGFFSFLLAGRSSWKRWLPGFFAHGVVAAILASPIVYFNWQYDFAPLRFQWAHAMQSAAQGRGWLSFLEFIGTQTLAFGLLPIVLLPWAWANLPTLSVSPRLRVCLAMYAVPMSFFLYKACRGPLEANWALVSYLGFWPLAAVWWASRQQHQTRWFALSTFIVPLSCVVLLAIHAIQPIPLIRPQQDRLTRQAERLTVMAEIAEAIRHHGEPYPVFTPYYQNVSLLRYQGLDARQIPGASRASNFTLTPDRLSDYPAVYVVHEGLLPYNLTQEFHSPEIVGNFPLLVRGELATCYQILLYRKAHP